MTASKRTLNLDELRVGNLLVSSDSFGGLIGLVTDVVRSGHDVSLFVFMNGELRSVTRDKHTRTGWKRLDEEK